MYDCTALAVALLHRLINYIDTKAKCRHLKKFTCKVTLRQVLIRVYRLEIQSVMLVFSTQLCELFSLPNLLSGSNPFPVWRSILFTLIQCVRGEGLWGSGSQTDKHLPQSLELMLSSGRNVIIWDYMLSSGMQCYHLELMLSSGANVIIWDKMLSSGANIIMV